MIAGVPHEGIGPNARHESFFHALFEAAGVWAPVTIAIVGGAIAFNLKVLVDDLKVRINIVPFAEQLKKLIAAGNAERAMKLCHAAETTVAARVALIGLEARSRNQDARAAMVDARTKMIQVLRKGLTIALVVGAAGLIEGAVMVGAAIEKDFPENEVFAIGVLPSLLACLMVVNVLRFGSMQRDLDALVEAI